MKLRVLLTVALGASAWACDRVPEQEVDCGHAKCDDLDRGASSPVGLLVGRNCLGTLTHDPKTVVSAAHCGAKVGGTFRIFSAVNGTLESSDFTIEDVRPHPDFRRTGGSCFDLASGKPTPCVNDFNNIFGWLPHDIAVLRLSEPVTEVAPMRLPNESQRPQKGDELFHVGRPDEFAPVERVLKVEHSGDGWFMFETRGCVGDSGGRSHTPHLCDPDDPECENLFLSEAPEGDAPECDDNDLECDEVERLIEEEPAPSTSPELGPQTLLGVHSTGVCGVWAVDNAVATYVDWILPCDQRSWSTCSELSSSCQWSQQCGCLLLDDSEPGPACNVDEANVILTASAADRTVRMLSTEDGRDVGVFIDYAEHPELANNGNPAHADQGPDGRIYVLDSARDALLIFDTGGLLLEELPLVLSSLENPMSIDFFEGDVYVSTSRGKVLRYTLTGEALGALVESNTDVLQDILFLADGSLLVANSTADRVQHYSADGEKLGDLVEVKVPQQLQRMPNGNFAVSDLIGDEVLFFDLDGRRLTAGGDGVVARPRGVAALDNGNFAVSLGCSGGHCQIQEISDTGEFLNTLVQGEAVTRLERVTLPLP